MSPTTSEVVVFESHTGWIVHELGPDSKGRLGRCRVKLEGRMTRYHAFAYAKRLHLTFGLRWSGDIGWHGSQARMTT